MGVMDGSSLIWIRRSRFYISSTLISPDLLAINLILRRPKRPPFRYSRSFAGTNLLLRSPGAGWAAGRPPKLLACAPRTPKYFLRQPTLAALQISLLPSPNRVCGLIYHRTAICPLFAASRRREVPFRDKCKQPPTRNCKQGLFATLTLKIC